MLHFEDNLTFNLTERRTILTFDSDLCDLLPLDVTEPETFHPDRALILFHKIPALISS